MCMAIIFPRKKVARENTVMPLLCVIFMKYGADMKNGRHQT